MQAWPPLLSWSQGSVGGFGLAVDKLRLSVCCGLFETGEGMSGFRGLGFRGLGVSGLYEVMLSLFPNETSTLIHTLEACCQRT